MKQNTEIILPWEIDRRATKWQWGLNYLLSKDVPGYIWTQPGDSKEIDRIVYLMKALKANRNWIVCLTQDPAYMRTIYMYLVATWVLTTGTYYEEAVLASGVFSRDVEKEQGYIDTGLLVLPYFEYVKPLQSIGAVFTSSVLARRKVQRRPTITDLHVDKRVKDGRYQDVLRQLIDIYGTMSFNLFTGDRAKCVYMG